MPHPASTLSEPYCSNCGYVLSGATETTVCPECGRAIVDVLVRRGVVLHGRRYTSKARIFGLPLISIAFGPDAKGSRGVAKGFIALGDVAIGWIAYGGVAFGGVAMGGLAAGVISFGGLGAGALAAMGGLAIGGAAMGGGAIGGLARGGGAVGVVADGGGAVGWCARGGGAFGAHTISTGSSSDPIAVQVFDALNWFFGPFGSAMRPLFWLFAVAIGAQILLLVLARVRVGSEAFHGALAGARGGVEPDSNED